MIPPSCTLLASFGLSPFENFDEGSGQDFDALQQSQQDEAHSLQSAEENQNDIEN